ncbi:hypothetical protein [Sphingobacterium allocomposti]|nr:hypothetical protein [Sphingobacterium composti Yoo et al. 2007 non Ten et al. 2007]
MLNNALMTVEALAGLKDVSEITPDLLMELYTKKDLKSINKRLKSYTMLFTKNGPLHNDKANGDRIYESLLTTIISNFEGEGPRVCEISGLRFRTSFSDLYKTALKKLNFPEKEIQKKDTTIGRTWFPLIGGLGSDAQALPQAKFAVQIHPICIVILQFLPLSSLLYRGGILLVDSSNFELSKTMVAKHAKTLSERIGLASVAESIENVKNFAKGDYLSNVLEILKEKEDLEESYSDLNMWSFSNSGTGASCGIDRVPNSLIRKLQTLYRNPKIANELKGILARNDSSYSFLESLEGNRDWFLLYPSIFGSGKKAIAYPGVSPDFLETYYQVIGQADLIPTAKYIAGLIEKYRSKSFEKLLEKSDAWNSPDYKVELYKVLLLATENGKWSFEHQIAILDNSNELPIKNNYYEFHKIVHYYTQQNIKNDDITAVDVSESKVFALCRWLISLIQRNSKASTIKVELLNSSKNANVRYNSVIIDALNDIYIPIVNIIAAFYDENFNFRKNGTNELLRIFFSQPIQPQFAYSPLNIATGDNSLIQRWIKKIRAFARDYQAYYYAKYKNIGTGNLPLKKFNKTVDSFINERDNFYMLLNEIIFNTNEYIKEETGSKQDKWSVEDLMTDPIGNSNRNVCVTAITFLLKETAVEPLKEKLEQN